MDRLTRRDLFGTSAAIIGGIGLAACGGTSGTPSIPTIPIKIEIPEELKDALAAVAKLDSLRSLLPASVGVWIDRAKDLAEKIVNAVSSDNLMSLGGQLVALLGSLTEYLPKTGTTGTVVMAIETLLPLIGQAVGLRSRMAARRPTGMSVQQARAILRS